MDEDDRPGYLMDFISSWAKTHGIDSKDTFNESFQSDSWSETIEDFAEEVLNCAGIFDGANMENLESKTQKGKE